VSVDGRDCSLEGILRLLHSAQVAALIHGDRRRRSFGGVPSGVSRVARSGRSSYRAMDLLRRTSCPVTSFILLWLRSVHIS
jgi:hypothetical protein